MYCSETIEHIVDDCAVNDMFSLFFCRCLLMFPVEPVDALLYSWLQMRRVNMILDEMRRHGIPMTEFTYTLLIRVMSNHGDVDGAVSILHEMVCRLPGFTEVE